MAPLGIIAGLGQLPVQVARAATARGQGVYILRLQGFIEPALEDYPGQVVGFAAIGKLFKAFKTAGCEEICFAGIVKRPDLSALKPDFKGISLLPKVLAAARRGDDALLRAMIEIFEDEGFKVIGADEAAGHMLARPGLLAGRPPDEAQMSDLRKAAQIASEMGRLDIGQGAIICDGLILCVEAQEGTDEMLAQCARLDVAVRGTDAARRGVLVKRPKPMQERRIDLPTVGVKTIEGVAAAGLAGIGIEAGGALLLDEARVLARAEELGIFLFAFARDWS